MRIKVIVYRIRPNWRIHFSLPDHLQPHTEAKRKNSNDYQCDSTLSYIGFGDFR
jgi:hypothetical protein